MIRGLRDASDVMGIIMIAIAVFIRNLVLAGILAWLGLEFAPPEPDESADTSQTESVVVSMLG